MQRELGLAPSVDALVLSTVLDYKRHLQEIDPDTGRPREKGATIAKQLSALRGFARWLALDDGLGGVVDPRIQLVNPSGPPSIAHVHPLGADENRPSETDPNNRASALMPTGSPEA